MALTELDEHDYAFKKKHAIKFLEEGAKLKAFVFFKGRSIIFKEQGHILLLRLAQDLEEYGKVEHALSCIFLVSKWQELH